LVCVALVLEAALGANCTSSAAGIVCKVANVDAERTCSVGGVVVLCTSSIGLASDCVEERTHNNKPLTRLKPIHPR